MAQEHKLQATAVHLVFCSCRSGPAFGSAPQSGWSRSGAWLLARRLGANGLGAALAGFAFAFCAFQVVWISSCLTNVAVLAPWLLLAVDAVIEQPRAGRTALLALAAWQVLVGGHPETSLYVGLGAAAFGACRGLGSCQKGRTLGALAVSGGAAALLAAPQWLPFPRARAGELRPAAAAAHTEPVPARARTVLGGRRPGSAAAFAAAAWGVALWRKRGRAASGRAGALLLLIASRATLRAARAAADARARAAARLVRAVARRRDVPAGRSPTTTSRPASAALRSSCWRSRRRCAAGTDGARPRSGAAGRRRARLARAARRSAARRGPADRETGSTRALAFVALALALLAALGVTSLSAGAAARCPAARAGLGRCMVAALALVAGALVPVESNFAHATDAPTLTDAGPDGLGTSLSGECAAAGPVTILANGVEGRADAGEGGGRGKGGVGVALGREPAARGRSC